MRKIFYVIMGLLFVGVGSAALVTYLSNMVSTTMNVQSPMSITTSSDGIIYDGDPKIFDMFGGETMTVYAKTKNLANATITGTALITVNNPDGVTCTDFQNVIINRTGIVNEYLDVTTLCSVISGTSITFQAYTSSSIAFQPQYQDIAVIQYTFKPGVTGSYTTNMQITI